VVGNSVRPSFRVFTRRGGRCGPPELLACGIHVCRLLTSRGLQSDAITSCSTRTNTIDHMPLSSRWERRGLGQALGIICLSAGYVCVQGAIESHTAVIPKLRDSYAASKSRGCFPHTASSWSLSITHLRPSRRLADPSHHRGVVYASPSRSLSTTHPRPPHSLTDPSHHRGLVQPSPSCPS